MPTRRTWLLAAALTAPLLFTLACDDDDDNGTGPDATLQVVAGLTNVGGSVAVSDGGTAVDGATVTLNGTAATPGGAAGAYDLVLPATVAAGGALTLDVASGSAVVQGTGTVPEAAVITRTPALSSRRARMRRLTVLSSTTSAVRSWPGDSRASSDGSVFPVPSSAPRSS